MSKSKFLKRILWILPALVSIMSSCACSSDEPGMEPENPGNNGGGSIVEPPSDTRSLSADLRAIAEGSDLKMLLCAHRANTFAGIRANVPENSVAAIEKAASEGIDMVELDPRATSDGVLVIMHNGSIDATTNGKGSVSGMTYDNLYKYNLTVGGTVTPHKVPTLSEALDAAKDKIFVCLDIKDFNRLDDIVKMVVSKGMSDQVCYYSGSSTSYLDQILRIDKNAILMPWVSDPAKIAELKRFYTSLQTVQFNYDASNIDALTSAVNGAGLVGYANHLNHDTELIAGKFTTMQGFVAKRIPIVQSDYCDVILPWLQNAGLRL
ncbi:MAG: glycerophosphodiester phosphodiesterase family protein [Muribaculaceae bacterium]|nr:glycerophosphodiester phosphodiesterase family protein [Muribaculaceae bacterium]